MVKNLFGVADLFQLPVVKSNAAVVIANYQGKGQQYEDHQPDTGALLFKKIPEISHAPNYPQDMGGGKFLPGQNPDKQHFLGIMTNPKPW